MLPSDPPTRQETVAAEGHPGPSWNHGTYSIPIQPESTPLRQRNYQPGSTMAADYDLTVLWSRHVSFTLFRASWSGFIGLQHI